MTFRPVHGDDALTVKDLPLPHWHVGIREQKRALLTRHVVSDFDNPSQVFPTYEAAEDRLKTHVGGAVMKGYKVRRVDQFGHSVLLRGLHPDDPGSVSRELWIRMVKCRSRECGAGRSTQGDFWMAPAIGD